jgi:hypothetical protein
MQRLQRALTAASYGQQLVPGELAGSLAPAPADLMPAMAHVDALEPTSCDGKRKEAASSDDDEPAPEAELAQFQAAQLAVAYLQQQDHRLAKEKEKEAAEAEERRLREKEKEAAEA